MQVVELNGPRDYRLERMQGLATYLTPLSAEADAAMDAAFKQLTDCDRGSPETLTVLEREVFVPQAARGVARFPFDALCRRELGAADYLALARRFHTILIDGVPRLGPEDHNAARRFTVLIDTLYDQRVKLICSAAAPPMELCTISDDTQWFKRTASRLVEMQSADYLRTAYRPAGVR
jgi:cell division protein ZapE